MTHAETPDIIVSRLPVYLRALQHMQEQGKQTTSSQELGEWVGVSAAQIRKDLSQFGGFGKQGTGYNIGFLVTSLREILHIQQVWDVAVVGMGDMGHAVARYQGFANKGFRVVMLFDSDPKKVGTRVGDFIVRDAANMIADIHEAKIQVAMLCVPANVAQAVSKQLVEAGVRAILNYAPINLLVPDGIRVQYIDPAVGLQRMTYYLG
jgi:redox-sensing transcriptional repressor